MKNNITLIALALLTFLGIIATVINMIWVIVEIVNRMLYELPFDWSSALGFVISLALLIVFSIILIDTVRVQQKAKFMNQGNKSFEDYINRLKDEEND